MPLPLLPGIILGSSAIAAAKGIYHVAMAGKGIKKLHKEYNQRKIQYEYSESYYRKHRERLNTRLEQLGKIRLAALVTLGEAVVLIKKARIRERHLFEQMHISEEQLTEWEGVSLQALNLFRGIASSTGAGFATAAGTYGLVGTIGVASTGTAISTLSGAAATNATLAWLGGGALAAGGGGMALGTLVLGGLVTGPALLVGGFFASRQLEKVRTEVIQQFAEMDIAEARMAQQIAEFQIINTRIDEMEKSTRQADAILRDVLLTANSDCIDDVFKVAKLAKAVAEIIDVKVISETNTNTYE